MIMKRLVLYLVRPDAAKISSRAKMQLAKISMFAAGYGCTSTSLSYVPEENCCRPYLVAITLRDIRWPPVAASVVIWRIRL